MNRKIFQVALPATFVVVMVAFLSAFFFANTNLSFAASSGKKTPAVSRTSAVDYTESRIKQLHSMLKITEAQKELWNNVTVVMRENAAELDAMNKDKSEETKTMNAVESLKFHSQITEAHLAQQKKLIPVFEALYTSMSDDQKTITDAVFRTGKHGKKKIS
jgi:hypothetical protein